MALMVTCQVSLEKWAASFLHEMFRDVWQLLNSHVVSSAMMSMQACYAFFLLTGVSKLGKI